MHYDISFPHLGIHLEHVGKTISVFGFEIAYYGIIIGTAILLGFVIATSEAKRTGQDPESYLDMGMFGVVFGIIGARLYYVLFSWDMYKDNLLEILNIREGGLAIYGGVIAAVLTVIIAAKIKHLSAPQIFDTIALALLNGQMLGRWGNFFNHEAFGSEVSLKFLNSLHLPDFIIQNMYIDGAYHHPTFLYESVGNIIAFLLIIFVIRKFQKHIGMQFFGYFVFYGVVRFFVEGLRADSLMFGPIRMAQLISIVFFAVGIVGMVYVHMKGTKVEEFQVE